MSRQVLSCMASRLAMLSAIGGVILLGFLGGCSGGSASHSGEGSGQASGRASGRVSGRLIPTPPVRASPTIQPDYQPPAMAYVYQMVLPAGTFTGQPKIWHYLKPEVANSSTRLLRLNGFRAGVGNTKVWPNIRKLIDVPGATTKPIFCQINGTAAITVRTRAVVRREMLVYRSGDGSPHVRSYRGCDNVMLLAMSYDKKTRSTIVELEPAVDSGVVHFTRPGGAIGIVGGQQPVGHLFARLQIAAPIPLGHFLVIAPVKPHVAPFSIGVQFLCGMDQVPAKESVLVVVPVR